MFIEMGTRKYHQKQRARQVQETRRKIVQAAMDLHETQGPANTSIKAVADRAGVQRLTVYRHFPDDTSLYQACTSHWLELNPPPDPGNWAGIESADERNCAALLAFCRYYRATADMWRVTYRDLDQVEALQEPVAGFEAFLGQVRDDLLRAWSPPRPVRKNVAAILRHALRFTTWQSLHLEKLSEQQKAKLLTEWVQAIVRSVP
jgi:AcrR family transcriptional regulator